MGALAVAVVMAACGSQAPSPGNAGATSGGSASGGSPSGATPAAGSDDSGANPVGSSSGSGASSGPTSGGSPAVDSGGDGSFADAMPASSEGGASTSDASGASSDGIFPPVTDPGAAGPYTPTTTLNTGPNSTYTIFSPKELGQGGIKSPIIIWGDGGGGGSPAGGYPAVFANLSSHGFVTIGYQGTPVASQMTAAIDWMIAQATDSMSVYYNKIDPKKIAAMGHSSGSSATWDISNDPRLTTTMHLDGGTLPPHTGLMNVLQPTAEICGDVPPATSTTGVAGVTVGDEARTYCDYDWANTTTQPIWYGDVIGAAHITITGSDPTADPKLRAFVTAITGWVLWQLAGNTKMKDLFLPAPTGCGLCKETTVWTVQGAKNL
jgi:hypothetical protein